LSARTSVTSDAMESLATSNNASTYAPFILYQYKKWTLIFKIHCQGSKTRISIQVASQS